MGAAPYCKTTDERAGHVLRQGLDVSSYLARRCSNDDPEEGTRGADGEDDADGEEEEALALSGGA